MFENFDWIGAMRSSPVMVILPGCSIVTFGFAIERALYFRKRRGHPEETYRRALAQLRMGNAQEAVWTCLASPHPLGPVAAQVIEHAGQNENAAEDTLQVALREQRLDMERHLALLGTMRNTAPLIVLLGVVWGIMRAVHDLGRAGSVGPSVVATGVAEALFATAAGLLVAVPAVMLYKHFTRQIAVRMTIAENRSRLLRRAML